MATGGPGRRQEGGVISELRPQPTYLRRLQESHALPLREVARRSAALAEALGQPQLAFSHQALSAWLSGRRNPRFNHRRALAMIFNVSFEELNRHLDPSHVTEVSAAAILRPAVVVVHGNERKFEYRVTLRSDFDPTVPAVLRSWSEIFRPFPAQLVRHYSRLRYTLFGWIPDRSAYPFVRHAHSLVPLEEKRALPGGENAVYKDVWFLALPDGNVDVGIAYREGRWIVLSKPDIHETKRYPLARIDLLGRVIGKALFHVKAQPA